MTRCYAAIALSILGEDLTATERAQVQKELLLALEDSGEDVREEAALALAAFGPYLDSKGMSQVRKRLILRFDDRRWTVRKAATRVFITMSQDLDSKERALVREELLEALNDPNEWIRQRALEVFGALAKNLEFTEQIQIKKERLQAFGAQNKETRLKAALALGALAPALDLTERALILETLFQAWEEKQSMPVAVAIIAPIFVSLLDIQALFDREVRPLFQTLPVSMSSSNVNDTPIPPGKAEVATVSEEKSVPVQLHVAPQTFFAKETLTVSPPFRPSPMEEGAKQAPLGLEGQSTSSAPSQDRTNVSRASASSLGKGG
jgi:hypothetical protein